MKCNVSKVKLTLVADKQSEDKQTRLLKVSRSQSKIVEPYLPPQKKTKCTQGLKFEQDVKIT